MLGQRLAWYIAAVSGIVGAGGNVGATGFGLAFRNLDYGTAFNIMGGTIIFSSFLCFGIFIEGQTNLWSKNGVTDEAAVETPNNRNESVFSIDDDLEEKELDAKLT